MRAVRTGTGAGGITRIADSWMRPWNNSIGFLSMLRWREAVCLSGASRERGIGVPGALKMVMTTRGGCGDFALTPRCFLQSL
jgi:hypothetical protein